MRAMEFELTPETIERIGFAMEDQDSRHVIDTATGEIVPLESVADPVPERYAPLPRWGPAEGFHMMQGFVATLHNSAYRETLAQALAAGRGVFRAFKDALKGNPEIERLWFRYKGRHLRSVIVAWYNAHREAQGLEKLAPEPEETDELVASDFFLAWGERGHLAEILALDREAFFELFPHLDAAELEARYREKRAGLPPPGSVEAPVLVAETPTGELVGFAWGLVAGEAVHMVNLTVVQELRRVGLGEALLRRFLADMRKRGARTLTTELAGKSLRFSGFFQSIGFTPRLEVLECSLDQLAF